MDYHTRSMNHLTRAMPMQKRAVVRTAPTRQVRVVESDHPAKRVAKFNSHAGATIKAALSSKTGTFISPAAEAHWAHQLLAQEFLQLCEQERYGAWDSNPMAAEIMKIELRSAMAVLQ